MRRTKIVATLGPATWEPDAVRDLIRAGADVFRLNLAHATPEQHAATAAMVRKQARNEGRTVGLLADLPGPKMRTGDLSQPEVRLRPGDTFSLTSDDIEGNWERVSTTVRDLPAVVERDDEIFLADGEIILKVTKVGRREVDTEVIRGGTLRPRKGMHLPRAERRIEAFTDDDRAALQRALDLGVDLVGLSFVRDAADIARLRAALPDEGPQPLVVAKIETASAVENLDPVVEAADAVMVARGDLGIQLPFSQVPQLQKEIICACNERGRPVITATQMLESMTHAPLPTRAEATDIANAVTDGTDAVMLSEETAIGEYPVEAVKAMSEIVMHAEAVRGERQHGPQFHRVIGDRVSWAVAHAAVQAAEDLGVTAILCPTRSGATALRVAAFRPSMPIVAMSDQMETVGALSLAWGVSPLLIDPIREGWTAEEDVSRAAITAREHGFAKPGQHVAIVAGSPGHRAGSTDYVRIYEVP